MIGLFKKAFWYILGTQEPYNKNVRRKPRLTQEACERVVKNVPWKPYDFRDHLWTQEGCKESAEKFPLALGYVPDQYITQEMCNYTVHYYLHSLLYVPDWFITREWIDMWHDDYYKS